MNRTKYKYGMNFGDKTVESLFEGHPQNIPVVFVNVLVK